MVFFPAGTRFRIQLLRACICLAISSAVAPGYADDGIQFNTDVLDVNDRKNIDLSQFSRSGYMMPGAYSLTVHINKNELPEQNIHFYPPEDDPKGSQACLSPALVEQLGLKADALKALRWWHQDECLDTTSLKGMEARAIWPLRRCT
ncbi:Outer membrane usher protein papC precursor [Serratia plymuthica]|uniref:Outer membrane usher protein papC n=1 Tax=Serratia plymuthica TaxID=82996 RepID=A0A2X4VLV7_SERPL|nr:Outer membrane usher protein papC precursor [Serratia plymuthica]